jgi:hypothetical protein
LRAQNRYGSSYASPKRRSWVSAVWTLTTALLLTLLESATLQAGPTEVRLFYASVFGLKHGNPSSNSQFLLAVSPSCALRFFLSALTDFVAEVRNLVGDVGTGLLSASRCNQQADSNANPRTRRSPLLSDPRHWALDDCGRVVASLDRKRLGADFWGGAGTSIRGVFDEETRRKPLAFAADAVRYGICPVIGS